MKTGEPFSQDALNKIFMISPKHPDRLVSRESSWLEFKEAFGFKSLGRYIRSAAAFANAKGGYIVYGVANRPHKLIGLKEHSFDDLDPEKLTQFLNEHFDPEIEWTRHLHELNGKTFGLLYVAGSRNRPVICKKGTDDGKHLKEGEIYYRYSGRTQTIRYAELKELIDERRKHEQLLWFKHLKEIARVGIQDAGVFDLRSGKVSGTGGHFFIDESLLSQVSFIREGEFTEKKGTPTLKIIGETQRLSGNFLTAGGTPQIIKTKGIRAPDVILGFLTSQKVHEPQSYLTQICYENTAFLPFYYLTRLAGLTLAQAKELITNEPSTQPAKAKLLTRITDDISLKMPMPSSGNPSGQRKLKIRERLLKNEIPASSDSRCLRDILSVIRTLSKKELDVKFVKSLLEKMFNKHYAHGDGSVNNELRRTVCYVDWLLNRGDANFETQQHPITKGG